MIRVAIVIAVGEVRPDLSQVAYCDRLRAHHAGRLRAGRPAINQDESHVALPMETVDNASIVKPREARITTCGRLPDAP